MNDDIMHRNTRQIFVKSHERIASVQGNVQAVVSANVQKVGIFGVFFDDVDGFGGQILSELLPRFAVVF